MKSARRAPIVSLGFLAILSAASPAAEDGKAALDPRGRPDERLIKQSQRFYLWYDEQDWHLRTAAKGNVKFEGTVRVVGDGYMRKCRPLNLESKGNLADRWALDEKRQELRFVIYTSSSTDGFDLAFGRGATTLEFDLTIGGQKRPGRIFLGRKAVHPPDSKFTLPADPDRALAKKPPAKEG